jgi:hypothetical protein
MFQTLARATEEGLAAGLAFQMNPSSRLMADVLSSQIETMGKDNADADVVRLDRVSDKIEELKAAGADGQTIKIYQEVQMAVAARITKKR